MFSTFVCLSGWSQDIQQISCSSGAFCALRGDGHVAPWWTLRTGIYPPVIKHGNGKYTGNGGLEPWNFMTFHIYIYIHILGMSSSQLTFTPSFFRGVGQPPTRRFSSVTFLLKPPFPVDFQPRKWRHRRVIPKMAIFDGNIQCGAPKIATLVYNSNNYGLWYANNYSYWGL